MRSDQVILFGSFPETGRFTVKFWAEKVLDCTEETLNDWVKRRKIPVKDMPGRSSYIDAKDFWDAIPFRSME